MSRKVLYDVFETVPVRILGVINSPSKLHKYRAIFENGSYTDFGAKGFEDFTTIEDRKDALKRKAAYLKRHKKNEDWEDPKSAGALSRWLLWNKPTLEASFEDYTQRFNMRKVKRL